MKLRFDNICNRLLVLFCTVFILFMTVMSALFSQRCGREVNGEIDNGVPIYQIGDNLLLHIIGIALLLGIFVLIMRMESILTPRKLFWCQIAVALIAGAISFGILMGGTRTPANDQAQVYGAASLFNQGEYINLEKGGYLNMYPQQLGLVAYLQIVFHIFGNYNFFAVQVLNCFWMVGLVFTLCLCLNELTEHYGIRLAGSLLLLPLLPLFLLSSWVYGDIPGFFFLALLFLQYLKYLKDAKKGRLFALIPIMCMCLIFRKNSLIAMIALCIALLFDLLRTRRLVTLAAAALIVLIPMGTIKGIELYYQNVSGYEVDGGLPAVMWISMGMSEDSSNPGWFSNYCIPLYYSVECDRTAATQIALDDIDGKISLFLQDPLYGISFYKRKICTQWNDPFYNTNFLIGTDEESKGLTKYLLQLEDHFLLPFLSVFQLILYLGLSYYCISTAFKKNVSENILLIFMGGGILFSILWEANSRYIFPYILMTIPLSAVGWGQLTRKILGKDFFHATKNISKIS